MRLDAKGSHDALKFAESEAVAQLNPTILLCVCGERGVFCRFTHPGTPKGVFINQASTEVLYLH